MQMTDKALRTLLCAAAALTLAAGAAAAQSNPFMPKMSLGGPDKQRSTEQKERDQAIDRAYQAANKKIPDQKSAADPWAGVRPASQTTSQTAAQNKKPQ